MSEPLLVKSLDAFVEAAIAKQFRAYGWGQKGPSQYDCSGLVTASILEAGGPDLRQTHNSQVMYLPPKDTPKAHRGFAPATWKKGGPVLLAFYGKDDFSVEHVMLALPDGRAFGACGGGRKTVTLADAARDRAFVRYQPTHNYRRQRDLLGYRELRYRP
ncbi:MAG: NlpC/P60 family protein [Cystobacter sp.]